MARNVRFGYNVHCSIASNADDGDDDDDNGCKVDTFTTVPTDICIEVDLSHTFHWLSKEILARTKASAKFAFPESQFIEITVFNRMPFDHNAVCNMAHAFVGT